MGRLITHNTNSQLVKALQRSDSECSSFGGSFISLPSRLREYCGRGIKNVKPEAVEEGNNMLSSGCNTSTKHKNLPQLWLPAHDLHNIKLVKILEWL